MIKINGKNSLESLFNLSDAVLFDGFYKIIDNDFLMVCEKADKTTLVVNYLNDNINFWEAYVKNKKFILKKASQDVDIDVVNKKIEMLNSSHLIDDLIVKQEIIKDYMKFEKNLTQTKSYYFSYKEDNISKINIKHSFILGDKSTNAFANIEINESMFFTLSDENTLNYFLNNYILGEKSKIRFTSKKDGFLLHDATFKDLKAKISLKQQENEINQKG